MSKVDVVDCGFLYFKNETMSIIMRMANGTKLKRKESLLPIIIQRCDERRRLMMVNIVRTGIFPLLLPFFFLLHNVIVMGKREGKSNRKNNVRCKQTLNRKSATKTTLMAERENIYIFIFIYLSI